MRARGSEIQINAPPRRVWRALTDFDAYPEWNPFIRSIQGDPEVGSRLSARIEPPGARGMTLRPTVRALEPGRELRWLGHLLIPGLADAEHRLALEPLDGGRSRFVQSERFSGLLVGVLRSTLAATQRGFEQMNQALKRRAEEGIR